MVSCCYINIRGESAIKSCSWGIIVSNWHLSTDETWKSQSSSYWKSSIQITVFAMEKDARGWGWGQKFQIQPQLPYKLPENHTLSEWWVGNRMTGEEGYKFATKFDQRRTRPQSRCVAHPGLELAILLPALVSRALGLQGHVHHHTQPISFPLYDCSVRLSLAPCSLYLPCLTKSHPQPVPCHALKQATVTTHSGQQP